MLKTSSGRGHRRCLLLSSYPDELASLEKRAATNFWHTLMGVAVPLAVAMQTSGTCHCQPLNHQGRCYNGSDGVPAASSSCECGCVQLIRPPVSPTFLQLQLAPLSNVVSIISNESVYNASRPRIHYASRPGDVRQQVTYLQRCDIVMAGRAQHAAERHARNYLEACAKERHWLKVRQLFGAFAGMDFECAHAPGPGQALFIPREQCGSHPGYQVHQGICLSAASPKLQQVRGRLESQRWRTVVKTFDQLTLVEQMRMVAGSSIVVYGHGAALSNMLWARPGTLIVEITPYLTGDTLDEKQQRQRISVGREMFQKLSSHLSQVGLRVRHLAVPTAKEPSHRGGEDCNQWGCYSSQKLAQLMLDKHAALAAQSTPLEALSG